jgi:transglutaminase-like putative cysteine protease
VQRDRHSTVRWSLLAALAAHAAGCAAHTVPRDRSRSIVAATVVSEPAASPAPPPPTTRAARREPRSLELLAFGGLNLSGDVRALRDGRPVAFLLRGEEPQRLSPQIARVHPELERTEGGVVIEAGQLAEEVVERHRRPSFLIDSDHPLLGKVAERLRGADVPAAVRARVAAYFERPAHGEFWRASYAAAMRAGDCTEHAVVAAAIARRLGRPSRIVLGYALLSDGERGVAIGHAWAEIHDGLRWQRVDATGLADSAAAYLVMGELSDEGPGFQRSLARLWAMLNVSGIEVLARPEARAQ